jgi:hypothetical protein
MEGVPYVPSHVGDALSGDHDDIGRGGGAPGLGPPLPKEKRSRSTTPEASRNSRMLLAAALWATPSAVMLVNGGPRGRAAPHSRGPARPHARRGADVPEAQVVGASMDGIGAREEERAARGEVVRLNLVVLFVFLVVSGVCVS